MAKELLSAQIIERIKKVKKLAETNAEIKRDFDAMIFTFRNCKMSLVDITTKYPNEEYARETYERRAKQLLGEIVGLDKIYVREFGEEPIYMDMNNPTKIVKILTGYETEWRR